MDFYPMSYTSEENKPIRVVRVVVVGRPVSVHIAKVVRVGIVRRRQPPVVRRTTNGSLRK